MPDKWVQNNSIFICDGQGFCVAPFGSTVCIGPVDENGAPSQTLLQPESNVSKPPDHILPLNDDLDIKESEVLLPKNKGGRPRKGENETISRMTKWRREREKQGILL